MIYFHTNSFLFTAIITPFYNVIVKMKNEYMPPLVQIIMSGGSSGPFVTIFLLHVHPSIFVFHCNLATKLALNDAQDI